MSLSEKINNLSLLKQKLLSSNNEVSKLADLGIEHDIPIEASVVIEQAEWINSALSDAFLGYEAFSKQNVSDGLVQFYKHFNADENFDVSDDFRIVLDAEFHPNIELDTELKNLRRFLPLYCFQGNYIVMDLLSENNSQILLIDGYLALYLAPDISQHISDLIDGLNDGYYHLDENSDVVFPSLWMQRLAVKAGKMKMDKYGEVKNAPLSKLTGFFKRK